MNLEPSCYDTKLATKRAKLVQLMQKFVPRSHVGIFRNDTPDPHHWTLNSCFGAFLSVWVHLEPFCYDTKLAAKRAKLVQLMQKSMSLCLVRMNNERSRSIPLGPNLIFWCISFRLGSFGTVSLLHETWCKTCQTGAINVKVCATKSCHNFLQRTLTIHTIGQ